MLKILFCFGIALFECFLASESIAERPALKLEGTAVLHLLRDNQMIVRDRYIFSCEQSAKSWRIALRSIGGDELYDEEVGTLDGTNICRLEAKWSDWGEKSAGIPPIENGHIDLGPLISTNAQIITKCIFLQWIADPRQLQTKEFYYALTTVRVTDPSSLTMESSTAGTFLTGLKGYAPGIYRSQGKEFNLGPGYSSGYLAWKLAALQFTNVSGFVVPSTSEYQKSGPKNIGSTNRDDVEPYYWAQFALTNVGNEISDRWLPVPKTNLLSVADLRWVNRLSYTNSLGNQAIGIYYTVTNGDWPVVPSAAIQAKVHEMERNAAFLSKKSEPTSPLLRATLLTLMVAPIAIGALALYRRNK